MYEIFFCSNDANTIFVCLESTDMKEFFNVISSKVTKRLEEDFFQ